MATEPEDTGMSDSAAVEQLLAAMAPAKGKPAEPSEEDDDSDEDEESESTEGDVQDDEGADPEDDDSDEGDEENPEDKEGDPEGGKGDETPEPAGPIADDAVVKVTVDGQETEFTIGTLKALAGQEASLTRKTAEVDVVGGRAAAALQGALESVTEDLEPYKGVDWVLEGSRMDPEEFQWHRDTFNRLTARYDKLVGSAQEFDKTVSARNAASRKDRSEAALKALSDPKTGIPGWNDQVRSDIVAYGISQGLDKDDAEGIVDAPVLKLIHKAMLFDKGQKAAAEKVNSAPQKVRKSANRDAPNHAPGKSQRVLEKKLASGNASDDDAMAALLGRWGVSGN